MDKERSRHSPTRSLATLRAPWARGWA